MALAGTRICGPNARFSSRIISPGSGSADYAALVSEIALCRAATADHDLDETFLHTRVGQQINLRWAYVYMIEECARHAGHADWLRERIGGSKGSLR